MVNRPELGASDRGDPKAVHLREPELASPRPFGIFQAFLPFFCRFSALDASNAATVVACPGDIRGLKSALADDTQPCNHGGMALSEQGVCLR
jgi:hypothetical protein